MFDTKEEDLFLPELDLTNLYIASRAPLVLAKERKRLLLHKFGLLSYDRIKKIYFFLMHVGLVFPPPPLFFSCYISTNVTSNFSWLLSELPTHVKKN